MAALSNDPNDSIKMNYYSRNYKSPQRKKQLTSNGQYNIIALDLEKSRSWSSAHDWKSCNRQKRFEGSNPSFSVPQKPPTAVAFVVYTKGIRTER